jgi:hypothetical protein
MLLVIHKARLEVPDPVTVGLELGARQVPAQNAIHKLIESGHPGEVRYCQLKIESDPQTPSQN